MSSRRTRTRGFCPTPKCDTSSFLRKDGKVRRHAPNEFCDGEPALPVRTFEVSR